MEHGQANGKEEAPQTVGAMLRQAREARSLSREHVSQRTRIAERHLRAIEEDRLFDLAGRTYAIGFSRAFAREVGLDEAMVADAVRAQLDRDERARPRAQPETFEPGDPSRVPSARLAWTTAVLGVLVLVVALALLWPSFLAPQGRLPDLL
ncbi:MAG: helix-turn-helix domain-containing protein, partial [Novosphingobium sp.]|nr:helix-turn-helix domain-containing protein [Novosphingobium sp.]